MTHTNPVKPPLTTTSRLTCLLMLSLCRLLQKLTTYLLHKKLLTRKGRKKLLAWHAQLNEAAVRRLRR